jgi:hypothetical protein
MTRLAVVAAGMLVGVVLVGGGCPTNSIGGSTVTPAGAWQLTSGDVLSSLVDFPPLTYLLFNADGTGEVYTKDSATGTLSSRSLTFSQSGKSLTVDIGGEVAVVSFSLPNATSLQLTDDTGAQSLFKQVAAVPPEAQCKSFQVGSRFDLSVLPVTGYTSGLGFDGTMLWFSQANTDSVYPVNPTTGVLGTPVTLSASQFDNLQTMQGADFWLLCDCGNDSTTNRRTNMDVSVSTVDTNTFADPVSIEAMAYDNGNNVLWLDGSRLLDRQGWLLEVNSNATPPTLLQNAAFDVSLRSLTWDGTHLWALTYTRSGVIIEVDVTTFQAVATYNSPDLTVEWAGIASVGPDLFLTGVTADNKGVLQKVTP